MVLCCELPYVLRGPTEVEPGTPAGVFLAEDDILSDGQHRYQHKMLMHHANTVCHSVTGTTEIYRCSVENNLTLVRPGETVENVHQRRLASPIFP